MENAPSETYEAASFFSNRACAFFPCHTTVDADDFNCLFCYCPLYALGPNCGGRFTYTESGIKSCMDCTLPHQGASGMRLVQERFAELAHLAGETS